MIRALLGWFKWLLIAAWLLVLLLVGAKLAQQNGQLIELELLNWQLPPASAGFVLCVTLLVGIALGLIAILPSLVYAQLRLKRARARLRKQEQSSSLVASGPSDG